MYLYHNYTYTYLSWDSWFMSYWEFWTHRKISSYKGFSIIIHKIVLGKNIMEKMKSVGHHLQILPPIKDDDLGVKVSIKFLRTSSSEIDFSTEKEERTSDLLNQWLIRKPLGYAKMDINTMIKERCIPHRLDFFIYLFDKEYWEEPSNVKSSRRDLSKFTLLTVDWK